MEKFIEPMILVAAIFMGALWLPTPSAQADEPTTLTKSVRDESGLYALVLRSRKPEARKLAKRVNSELLPSIRQTGGYAK